MIGIDLVFGSTRIYNLTKFARIGMLFTLRCCNQVRSAEQKSLRFVRDTKSNPVCAISGKAKSKQRIRYAPVRNRL